MPSADPGLVSIKLSVVGCVVVLPAPTASAIRRDARLFGEPEIENLRLASRGDKNIGGLDIAMNDPARVRRVERIRNLRPELEKGIGCHGRPPIRSRSVWPSSSSITRKGRPLYSPTS